MREVVIVDSVRTGLAKSFRGKFNQTRPDDMAAHCVNALLTRNGIDPATVEDCIVGAGSMKAPRVTTSGAMWRCSRNWAPVRPA